MTGSAPGSGHVKSDETHASLAVYGASGAAPSENNSNHRAVAQSKVAIEGKPPDDVFWEEAAETAARHSFGFDKAAAHSSGHMGAKVPAMVVASKSKARPAVREALRIDPTLRNDVRGCIGDSSAVTHATETSSEDVEAGQVEEATKSVGADQFAVMRLSARAEVPENDESWFTSLKDAQYVQSFLDPFPLGPQRPIAGPSFKTVFNSTTQLSVYRSFNMLVAALDFLRKQKVRYKAITSRNILRNEHKIYLADFGLAEDLDGGGPLEDDIARALEADVSYGDASENTRNPLAADVYSLGVTFAELLVNLSKRGMSREKNLPEYHGKPTFVVFGSLATMEHMLQKIPRSTRRYERLFLELTRAMLHEDPESRPSLHDITVFLQALDKNEPVGTNHDTGRITELDEATEDPSGLLTSWDDDEATSVSSFDASSIFSNVSEAESSMAAYEDVPDGALAQEVVGMLCLDPCTGPLLSEAFKGCMSDGKEFTPTLESVLHAYSADLRRDAGESLQLLAATRVDLEAREIAGRIKERYRVSSAHAMRLLSNHEDETSEDHGTHSSEFHLNHPAQGGGHLNDFLKGEAFEKLRRNLETIVHPPVTTDFDLVEDSEFEEEILQNTPDGPNMWYHRLFGMVRSVQTRDTLLEPSKRRVRWRCVSLAESH
ncbi:hypothetical protein B0J12DRAFT_447286 [Macrophomina phaseolina]|uniref:non-specific serine/threonine protein kinase n=1 Tax=Macrophomina phaseolina TaxID=35725 RepID=A0ABQ8GEZ0_9PEZI|nr:hypothetical protein B0J12DRAFT_447286 [Macrophomina phaseolina]